MEYAISATSGTAPSSGWQADRTFNGLTANTTYYVYARSAQNAGYNAGAAQQSAAIKTAAAEVEAGMVTLKVRFQGRPASDKANIETLTVKWIRGGTAPKTELVTTNDKGEALLPLPPK